MDTARCHSAFAKMRRVDELLNTGQESPRVAFADLCESWSLPTLNTSVKPVDRSTCQDRPTSAQRRDRGCETKVTGLEGGGSCVACDNVLVDSEIKNLPHGQWIVTPNSYGGLFLKSLQYVRMILGTLNPMQSPEYIQFL